jgi:hypothetical protein
MIMSRTVLMAAAVLAACGAFANEDTAESILIAKISQIPPCHRIGNIL